jgi:hypothetical protein
MEPTAVCRMIYPTYIPRLPRYNRAAAPRRFIITIRDRDIIRLVYSHRFLRSSQVVALIGGSRQQVLRRLQLLFHHGYLTRPRAQLEYFTKGGSREMVYGLGNKGAKLLRDSGVELHHVRWNEKNQDIGRVYLNHALLVSTILVAFEIACRSSLNIKFISRNSLLPDIPIKWHVGVNQRTSLGVVPDALFCLETRRAAGDFEREYFFLEADRGTMPVVRKDLKQTSMYRKLAAYEATWRNGILDTQFGFHRFRVLLVTTSPDRVASLLMASSSLKGGRGLFLFCDRETIIQSQNIFEVCWIDGKGKTTDLLSVTPRRE